MNTNKYSTIGSIIGLISLGIAMFHFFLGDIEVKSTFTQTIKNKVVELKDTILNDKAEVKEVSENNIDTVVDYIALFMGYTAIAFGIFGLLKKEELGICSVAIFLGILTMSFHSFLMLIGAVILGILFLGTLMM